MAEKWRCTICGYVHIEALPPIKCPKCGCTKEEFEQIEGGEGGEAFDKEKDQHAEDDNPEI